MKVRSLVLGVLLCAGFTPSAGADPIGVNVIGGETVRSAPWATQLYWSDDWFGCSASIIAPQWVLTAKHCVADGIPDYVLVGNVNRGRGKRADVVSGTNVDNGDMSLLYLATPIQTTYVRLADTEPPRDSRNYIYGWGTYEVGEGKPLSPALKRGAVTVTGRAKDAYGGRAVGSRWADAANGGTAGYGDSGGPQLYNGVQVGVCSTGDYTNQQYASVPAHRDWIREVSGV
ncbi:serine protease [Lentzea sp. NBRC 105346]|uniref:S1 family peptidase n=1 Tax=Lentzea sp. NBRC 105346 TaxID=3032205 RepID=UPI0024A48914|nr:trypsin-like serine protease [Lentzea sp. NBRC 105346]GLZ33641.1 serine protease [Lentzea sp. NBRC 105346]